MDFSIAGPFPQFKKYIMNTPGWYVRHSIYFEKADASPEAFPQLFFDHIYYSTRFSKILEDEQKFIFCVRTKENTNICI